jgi:transcriptional regulator with XRE-family HTH domain
MNKQEQQILIRTRKLGLLLYDARTASRRSLEETAEAAGITSDELQAIEKGAQSPSLPLLEAISFYLNIPLEHFWSGAALSEQKKEDALPNKIRLRQLRDRMIGASLRMQRTQLNFSLHEVSAATSISEDQLKKYELGEISIPLPELELLVRTLELHLEDLFDLKGPIGKWRTEQIAIQQFLELPPHLQEFARKPVNKPYLELAIRLSALSVDKLRQVAESLLEITY